MPYNTTDRLWEATFFRKKTGSWMRIKVTLDKIAESMDNYPHPRGLVDYLGLTKSWSLTRLVPIE